MSLIRSQSLSLSRRFGEYPVVLAAIALLVVGARYKLNMEPAPDAKPYLNSVARAYEQLPKKSSSLISRIIPVPTAATQILQPNVLDSRAWSDTLTGDQFSVLFVHCGDARDMLAHYPANCYVGSGYQILQQAPRTLESAGLKLYGTEYEFGAQRFDGPSPFYVFNVMVLSDQRQEPDMRGLYKQVRLSSQSGYGSGQIQIIVQSSVPESKRAELYERAIELYSPLIRAVQSDPLKAEQGPAERR